MEQLLETKRAEKPSTDFWSHFNNELRIKQRRLLQKQPIEALGLETDFWRRFKKIGTLCAAATSCGAIGFLVMQSIGPAITSSTAYVETPARTTAPAIQPSFTVEQSAPLTVATIAPAQPEFVEIPASAPQVENSRPAAQEPEAIAVLASNSASAALPRNAKDFILTMQTPFESLNIDESIEFDAYENITMSLMEKYIHPLSDHGLKHTQYVAANSDPLNRISTMALKSELFNVGSRSDQKLNTLSLKF